MLPLLGTEDSTASEATPVVVVGSESQLEVVREVDVVGGSVTGLMGNGSVSVVVIVPTGAIT
ncbi:hypothetical protein SDC9_212649 [bioreactor metagenome]|uniref:Uncharacterized protein n=1 Tax=bioreactor metagenome TaxID=1076179 RepID=A0A645JMM0_9ZZZZ